MPTARSAKQVIHDSLQEWNTDQFVELDWNDKAAAAILYALVSEGFLIVSPAGRLELGKGAAEGEVERLPQRYLDDLQFQIGEKNTEIGLLIAALKHIENMGGYQAGIATKALLPYRYGAPCATCGDTTGIICDRPGCPRTPHIRAQVALAAQLASRPPQGSEEVERLAEIACDAYEGDDGSYGDFKLTHQFRWQSAVRALLAALTRPQAGEVERLRAVLEAAKLFPRAAPGPGGASTLHQFHIEASTVWGLDRALRALEARQGIDGETSREDGS